MSPSAMPAAGIAVSTGTRARAGSWRQEQAVIRRGRLGHGRAVLLAHHGGGRGVVAEEQLAAWPGRRGGPPEASGSAQSLVPRGGAKVSTSVQSQRGAGVGELTGDGCSSRSSQIAVRACDGRPSGMSLASASATRPKVLGLPRSAGAGRASSPQTRAAAGRSRAAWSVPDGRGSGLGRAGGRASTISMPSSRGGRTVRRARTPAGQYSSIRGAERRSAISSRTGSGIMGAGLPRAAWRRARSPAGSRSWPAGRWKSLGSR